MTAAAQFVPVSIPSTMIEVYFLGCTNYRPSRWVARAVGNHKTRKVVSTGFRDAYIEAEDVAVALCAQINRTFAENPGDYRIVRSSVDGGGYVFAFVAAQEVAK